MDRADLKRLCLEQIDLGAGEAQIVLKQSGKWGKTNYRKFLGVRGEIVQDNFGDGLVVMYPAKELLAAICKLEVKSNEM